ncbi:MAG TPA: PilZ domain-containing protein [Candidatus Angelobacter sp.]|nr:PilZ domain-containing protein [Candidatus Angelobacter sp.]
MALQALLLSRDPEVHRTLRRVLDAANIETELAQRSEQARQSLSRGKYDAFLVDCDDTEGGPEVLKELRQGKSNKSCIAFAIVHGKTSVQMAFEMGANFVLDKPISVDRATRSVRAAQGLIMRERRRYHRHLLSASGAILVDSGAELPISITNISHGGISIECSRQLDQGGAARLKFILPGAKHALEVKGEVMWSNSEGQAGIRFQVLSTDMKKALDTWLDRRALPFNNGAMFINAVL